MVGVTRFRNVEELAKQKGSVNAGQPRLTRLLRILLIGTSSVLLGFSLLVLLLFIDALFFSPRPLCACGGGEEKPHLRLEEPGLSLQRVGE